MGDSLGNGAKEAICIAAAYIEILSAFAEELEGGGIVAFSQIHGECVPLHVLRGGVDIEQRREYPALTLATQKAVIARVVINIRYHDAEGDSLPQLN